MIILLVSWSYRSNSPCFCNCFGNVNNQQCAVLCWEGGGIPLVLLWFQLWWGRLERPLSSENSFCLTQNHFIICVSLQNCNGFRQSPIDVDFASTTASGTHSNGALTFGGYDQVIIITFIITISLSLSLLLPGPGGRIFQHCRAQQQKNIRGQECHWQWPDKQWTHCCKF